MAGARDSGERSATSPATWFDTSGRTVLLVTGLAAVGAVPALALGLHGLSYPLMAALAGPPLLLGIAVLVLDRFEWFVLTLLATRSSFDLLRPGQGGSLRGSGLDPASVIGVIFITSSLLWLYVQWASGRWVRPSSATWALVAFVGACMLSVPLSASRPDSLVITAKILAGVLMFAVIEQLLGRDPDRAPRILAAAFASFLVPAVVGLRQWAGGEAATRIKPNASGSNVLEGGSRVKGTFIHPNPFATYLVLVFLVALALLIFTRHHQRLVFAIVTALSGLLLVVTYTRVGWLAALVGAVYIGLRLSRVVLIAMAVIVVGVLVAVPSVLGRLSDLSGPSSEVPGVPSNSLSWRVDYWGQLLPLTASNPVTGVGIGTSQYEVSAVVRQEVSQSNAVTSLLPHSVFVQVFVETGLVGLGALVYVIVSFSRVLRRRLLLAGRGEWERTLAVAAIAICLAILVQMPTENLLDETAIYWYLAALGTFGYMRSRARHLVPA